jgi:sugar fermentation stimulation protein A
MPPLLPFPHGCIRGTLIRREKRFLMHCRGPSGPFLAHTNNSGAMSGLIRPGNPALVSPAPGDRRKLPWTLELVGLRSWREDGPILWVGVNTLTPNRLLRAAFSAGRLPWAEGYTELRAEVGRGRCRLDALLTGPGLPRLWVECKNVTLVEDEVAAFPDAVSERARKHAEEAGDIRASGERVAFFYCVQRPDARCFAPADYIDPVYADLFYAGRALGVECHAHRGIVDETGIDLGEELPLVRQQARCMR